MQVKAVVDLQLLQLASKVLCSNTTRNEQVKTSVCLINFDGSSAKVTLFRFRKILLFCKFLVGFGHLHFDRSLQFCFIADFNIHEITHFNILSKKN